MTASLPPHRILVLLTADRLPDELLHALARRTVPVEVRIIAPLLLGRLGFWFAVDDRKAVPAAQRRLGDAIAQAAELGVEVSGRIGDASASAVQMLEDEAALWRPDEVVIALQPEERETWSEHDLEDTAQLYVDVPVHVQHGAAAAG